MNKTEHSWPRRTAGVPRLSASRLALYLGCGERYRRKYVENESRSVFGLSLPIGIGTHSAAELDNASKVGNGTPAERSEAVDIAVSSFDQSIGSADELVEWKDDKPAKPTDVEVGKARDTTAKCAGKYVDTVSPSVVPVLAEEPVVARINVESGRAVELSGVLDYATDHGFGDLKTSSRSWTQDRADGHTQFSIYGILFMARFNRWPTSLWVDNIVHYKSKGPIHTRIRTARSENDYAVMGRKLDQAIRGIEAEVYLPPPDGDWRCSRKWCEFFVDCPLVADRRKKGE